MAGLLVSTASYSNGVAYPVIKNHNAGAAVTASILGGSYAAYSNTHADDGWYLYAPAGSSSTLSDAETLANVTFTPDVSGRYLVVLLVTETATSTRKRFTALYEVSSAQATHGGIPAPQERDEYLAEHGWSRSLEHFMNALRRDLGGRQTHIGTASSGVTVNTVATFTLSRHASGGSTTDAAIENVTEVELTLTPANASAATIVRAPLALAMNSIAATAKGTVVVSGIVPMDTSSWSVGDDLYVQDNGTLATTTGTNTRRAGIVISVGGGTLGSSPMGAIYFEGDPLMASYLTGPAAGTSTDHAIVRWHQTGGSSVQDSPNGPYVADSGRLGIGVTAPAVELDVDGAVNTTGKVTATGGILVNSSSSTVQAWDIVGNDALRLRSIVNGDIEIAPQGSGNTYISNGNVGIGVSAPTEKLEVAGNIKATGDVTVDGNITFNASSGASESLLDVQATRSTVGVGTTATTVGGAAEARFEIVDTTSPQARLSYTEDALDSDGNLLSSGVLTDLRTTSAGELFLTTTGGRTLIGEHGTGATAAHAALEVYKTSTDPQLRLSYNQVQKYADVQVDANGYLSIRPSHNRTGIGIASPSSTLHVNADADGAKQEFTHTSSGATWFAQYSSGNGMNMQMHDSNNSRTVFVRTYGDSYFNGGNFGIGTLTPLAKLHVEHQVHDAEVARFTGFDGITRLYGHAMDFSRAGNNYIRATSNTGSLHMAAGGSGNTRLTIDSNGNVGVGTTTPASAFTVTNGTHDAEVARFEGFDGTFAVEGGHKLTFSRGAANYLTATNPSGNFTFETGGAGNPRVRIAADGKVGIGTTSPTADLHIKNGSAGDALLRLETTSAGDPTVEFASQANRDGMIRFTEGGTVSGQLSYSHSDDVFKFIAASATSVRAQIGETTSYLTSDVGVGTEAPQARLHVHERSGEGNLSSVDNPTVALFQRNNASDEANVSIIGATAGSSSVSFGDHQDEDVGKISYDHGSNRFSFRTNGVGDRVVIDSSGNLGVGTSSPTTPLQVAGAATVDANMTVGGNLAVSGDTVVTGNLTVNGTTTTLDTTTVQIEDKNIELAVGATTDAGADGGGLTLKGASDKTIAWTNATDAWHFNQGINVTSGKIGIGTTTPAAPLGITDTTPDTKLAEFWGGDGKSYLQGGNKLAFTRAGNCYVTATSDDGVLVMENASNARVTLDELGRVGINTLSPATTFHAVSAANLFQANTNNTTCGVSIQGVSSSGLVNGNTWTLQSNAGTTFSLSNDASGSPVSHLTVTPNSTVASSTVSLPGKLTVATDLTLAGTTTVSSILDQDDMSSNSATALATQQSIKAYVDATNTLDILNADGSTGMAATLGSEAIAFSGTANEVDVSYLVVTDNGWTPSVMNKVTFGLPNDVTVSNDLTVTNNLAVTGNAAITGNLTVNGTTTTINSTTMTVDDKNIELGAGSAPTDVSADGGGITLKGDTDKTIAWTNATDAWHFNQGINVTSGKVGIGTTSPQRNLHIHQANSALHYGLSIRNNASGEGLQMGNNADGSSWINNNESDKGGLHLGGAGSAYNNGHVFISGAGDVGVGTTSPGTKFHVSGRTFLEGSQRVKITNIANPAVTTYTSTSSDYMIVADVQQGAIQVNLEAAATAGAGRQVIIKDKTGHAATNAITIRADGTETIDNGNGGSGQTFTINVGYGAATLVCDGSNHWYIV